MANPMFYDPARAVGFGIGASSLASINTSAYGLGSIYKSPPPLTTAPGFTKGTGQYGGELGYLHPDFLTYDPNKLSRIGILGASVAADYQNAYTPTSQEQALIDAFKAQYGEVAKPGGPSKTYGSGWVQVRPEWNRTRDQAEKAGGGEYIINQSQLQYDPRFGYLTPGSNVYTKSKPGKSFFERLGGVAFDLAPVALAAVGGAAAAGAFGGLTGAAGAYTGGSAGANLLGSGLGYAAAAPTSASALGAAAGAGGLASTAGGSFGDYSLGGGLTYGEGAGSLTATSGSVGLQGASSGLGLTTTGFPVAGGVAPTIGGGLGGTGSSWFSNVKDIAQGISKGNDLYSLATGSGQGQQTGGNNMLSGLEGLVGAGGGLYNLFSNPYDYQLDLSKRAGGQLEQLMKDPNNIKNNPAYQFRLNQGLEDLQRSAASKGMLGSGNILGEITRYSQGLASTEYDNEFKRLSGLAFGPSALQTANAERQTTIEGVGKVAKGAGSVLGALPGLVSGATNFFDWLF